MVGVFVLKPRGFRSVFYLPRRTGSFWFFLDVIMIKEVCTVFHFIFIHHPLQRSVSSVQPVVPVWPINLIISVPGSQRLVKHFCEDKLAVSRSRAVSG